MDTMGPGIVKMTAGNLRFLVQKLIIKLLAFLYKYAPRAVLAVLKILPFCHFLCPSHDRASIPCFTVRHHRLYSAHLW